MFQVMMLFLAFVVANTALAETNRTALPTGFVYDELFLQHITGAGHPERSERLTAIVTKLRKTGLLDELVMIKPAPASPQWIAAIHSPDYIQRVRQTCQAGSGLMDSGDTPVSARSCDAAFLAAGGVLSAVDAVMEGKVRNAFCAVRPPGHHALKDRAMGFCLFNNIAIAARYIQQKHKLAKVMIVDWDVHHGNGTQAAFYEDDTVYYFSAHASPFYPGTGGLEEIGAGKGLNFTLNAPLPAGSGDAEYVKVFEEKLKPAAASFKPDFVLVSAGFDAAQNDLLGPMKVTPAGYEVLTRIVKDIAKQYAHSRLVTVLEGGYNLESLSASVEAHLRALRE